MPLDRTSALLELIAYRLPLDTALEDLQCYGWDSDFNLVTLGVDEVIGVLDRYLSGVLTAEDVTRWANLVEGRDDIALAAAHQEALGMVIFSLANPEINTSLTPAAGKAIIDWRAVRSAQALCVTSRPSLRSIVTQPARPHLTSQLEQLNTNQIKLACLWASVTLCYVYCDYFELYQVGKLQSMLAGQMGPLGQATQGVLLGVAVLLSLPALMVFFSVALPEGVSRKANIVLGSAFTLIMVPFVLLPGVWLFYKYFALVEALLTAYAVRMAWRWKT